MKRLALVALLAASLLGCGLFGPTEEVTVWLEERDAPGRGHTLVELIDPRGGIIGRATSRQPIMQAEVSPDECASLGLEVFRIWVVDDPGPGVFYARDTALITEARLPDCGGYVVDVDLTDPATATVRPSRRGP